MKKVFVFAMVLLLIFGSTSFLYAKSIDTATTESNVSSYRLEVGEKAARGTKNILFGWTELPKRVVDITKETNNPIWGLFAGTFQGTLKAVARTFSGAVDVLTAPIDPGKPPLMQPDINVE